MEKGNLHPITQTLREIYAILYNLGFEVALGPELEYEYYNFDALNFPKDHPARDMQDTFWINGQGKSEIGPRGQKLGRLLLATQTSAGQVRYMETHTTPLRTVVIGKVFRNEATDATHEAQFYQVEPLYVDKQVSATHLKGILDHLFKKLFGEKVETRFRPSFFPFTEPSFEVDIKWQKPGESEPRWLEVVGAGLVHPNVLRAGGVDPDHWQGFAFAFGFDRIVMLKHGIDDIRFLYNGDLRLVNQF